MVGLCARQGYAKATAGSIHRHPPNARLLDEETALLYRAGDRARRHNVGARRGGCAAHTDPALTHGDAGARLRTGWRAEWQRASWPPGRAWGCQKGVDGLPVTLPPPIVNGDPGTFPLQMRNGVLGCRDADQSGPFSR